MFETQGGNIVFNDQVNSLQGQRANLDIHTAGGIVELNADLGSKQFLGELNINGPTQLNANINTDGNQTYTDTVVLNPSTGAVNLTTHGQNITFEQPLDSATPKNAALHIITQGGTIEI